MKKLTEMLHTDPHCMVRLTHYPDDICAWILESWEKGFPCRKNTVTHWYNTRQQAERAAQDIIRNHTAKRGV